jgi:hypothetical protein
MSSVKFWKEISIPYKGITVQIALNLVYVLSSVDFSSDMLKCIHLYCL